MPPGADADAGPAHGLTKQGLRFGSRHLDIQCGDACSGSNPQRSAQPLRTRLHTAHAGSRMLLERGGIEADSVVANSECEFQLVAVQLDFHLTGAAVFEDVGQGFLKNPHDVDAFRGW